MTLSKIDNLFLIKTGIFLTLCIELTSVPIDFSIPLYGNIFGFLIIFFVLLKNIKKSILAVFLIVFIFTFYLLINFDFYLRSEEPYKFLFYALTAILLSVEFQKFDYKVILEDVFFKYIIVITVIYFLGFGIDEAGGSLRIQGLMSEPSALSLILCFLFWTFLTEKKYKKLIFIIFVSLLTMSLVVYVHFFLFYIISLLLKANLKSLMTLAIITISFIIVLLFIQNIESDNWLINKASAAVIYSTSGGDEGKNTRAVDFQKIKEEQNRNEFSYYIGNGPNYGVYYYKIREMLTNTQNLPAIFFFNYGVVGLIIGLLWIIYSLLKLRNSIYNILFISSVSYSFINTASGIVNDIYLFVLLFYSLRFLFNNLAKPKKIEIKPTMV